MLALVAVPMAALAATAWSHYHPRSPLIPAAGLRGERATDAGRQCGPWYRQTRLAALRRLDLPLMPRVSGLVPLRKGSCRELHLGRESPLDREDVEFDRYTRRVTLARKLWRAPDSASWARSRDSIERALAARGFRRVDCGPRRSGPPGYEGIHEAWRRGRFDVGVYATPRMDGSPPSRWVLQVNAFDASVAPCRNVRALM